jgi:hypothetical protein
MKPRSILLIFLSAWLVINIIQAGFTGLFNDEAYYFFYSRDLAWGYYDHPPMVALLIKLGYGILHNELGVRLLYVLLSIGTILVIRKITEVKNELLFAVLYFSFLAFQITGFFALPDSILLFFTALFFMMYKRFSKTYSLSDGFLLGLVMAGMFYSKYLGIFIVFFTILSDIKLFTKKASWIAVLTTTILFLPHLFWQYRHDFPSVYYHMLERSHDEYFRWSNFGDFIVGQIGQINPFLFIPVLYFLARFKPGNAFERSLKFSALGCLLFPFIMMMKGRVEANWTMAGMVPLFIIAFKMFESRPSFNRFIYISGGISLILLVMVRVLLMNNFLPDKYSKLVKLDHTGWGEFSEKASGMANGRPVVFVGSYQNPSQYIFHTGEKAFSFNNALYRNNQYDLEGIEEELQGKEAMIILHKKNISDEDIQKYSLVFNDSIQYPNGKFRMVMYDNNYRSYNFIKADVKLDNILLKAGESVQIPVTLVNPSTGPVDFRDAAPFSVSLCYYFLQYGKPVVFEKVRDLSDVEITGEYTTSIRIHAPALPGTYYFKISIQSGWLPPGINSRLIKVKVR